MSLEAVVSLAKAEWSLRSRDWWIKKARGVGVFPPEWVCPRSDHLELSLGAV